MISKNFYKYPTLQELASDFDWNSGLYGNNNPCSEILFLLGFAGELLLHVARPLENRDGKKLINNEGTA